MGVCLDMTSRNRFKIGGELELPLDKIYQDEKIFFVQ